MADKKQGSWQGHPVVHPDHVNELERKSAIYEFHHGLPRQKAEQLALEEYRRDQHARAAAYHLSGMKAAHAAGELEASVLHHDRYAAHMKAMGLDAADSVPPHVKMHEDPSMKIYDFKEHGADQYLVEPKESKPQESKPAETKKSEDYRDLAGRLFVGLNLMKGDLIRGKFPQQQAQATVGPKASVTPIQPKANPITSNGVYNYLSQHHGGRAMDDQGDANAVIQGFSQHFGVPQQHAAQAFQPHSSRAFDDQDDLEATAEGVAQHFAAQAKQPKPVRVDPVEKWKLHFQGMTPEQRNIELERLDARSLEGKQSTAGGLGAIDAAKYAAITHTMKQLGEPMPPNPWWQQDEHHRHLVEKFRGMDPKTRQDVMNGLADKAKRGGLRPIEQRHFKALDQVVKEAGKIPPRTP